ncbi:dolichol-phosphate mannosyltransferase subunit 3-domain-containing protein [Lanmaoa asiatica]|nr:dolichol-phosphate mannosyltransferase subunit 3-domain-containing protein [Lanmaoa asiatica]KAH0834260.1 dolichol-phosphate mannosyltransferase subunit 3-domain-containing protein [Lanmaoa asiatica]
MTRAHRVAIYTSAFLLIYLLAFFAILPIPFLEPDTIAQLLPVIPWWLLVSFGAYSLASLGWGLFTFQDCPDAYHELLKVSLPTTLSQAFIPEVEVELTITSRPTLQEINDAKNDLRGKGVTVD